MQFEKIISLKGMIKAMLMLLFVTLFLFSCSSESSGSRGYTSKAFIFSLSNKEDLKPFKSNVSRPAYAINRWSAYGPIFGYTGDIFIADQANSNSNSFTDFGSDYPEPSGVTDPKTILAGSNYFTPDDWEVFYLA